jgi:FkbM family methyltransferase
MLERLPFGSQIKPLLEKNKTLRRWKYSEFGLSLWRRFAPENDAIIHREDAFYEILLKPLRSPDSVVFDIGANFGWTAKTFLRFSKKVVALEPDSFCQEVLANRFKGSKSLTIVPKAVSESEGAKAFLVQGEGSALNTFSEKWKDALEDNFFKDTYLFTQKKVEVQTTTLDQLIAQYGLPSFAKIDVEGHEIQVFRGLSQPIPLIVFEANLPVFLSETLQIVELLEKMDSQVQFRYSDNFQDNMPQFVDAAAFKQVLGNLGKSSIDIICRMSNYAQHFNPQ